MKKKALICIGASRLQSPTLRWAREAGLFVVATDRNQDAPGRELADRFVCVDGGDVDGLVALAEEVDAVHGLVGAYASSDFGLESVARIGAVTGTPANRAEAVRLSLDKDAATRIWRDRGLAVPEGRLVRNATELNLALKKLGTPVVVKPIGASGSMGVRVARSVSDAEEAFQKALAATEDSTGAGVLVEKRLEGRHLDVNAFFRDGGFRPAGILDRHFTPAPHCVPIWGTQPSTATAEEVQAVYSLVEEGARALGLEVGPVKADVIWTENGPYLLEIAPRFHGDVSTSFVSPIVYGKSPVQAWFASLADAGGPFDDMPARTEQIAGWMAVLPPHPGVVRGVHGLDQARAHKGIEAAFAIKSDGFRVHTLGDNRAVCGFLWAKGRTHQEVEEHLRAAHALVRVETEATCPSVA